MSLSGAACGQPGGENRLFDHRAIVGEQLAGWPVSIDDGQRVVGFVEVASCPHDCRDAPPRRRAFGQDEMGQLRRGRPRSNGTFSELDMSFGRSGAGRSMSLCWEAPPPGGCIVGVCLAPTSTSMTNCANR